MMRVYGQINQPRIGGKARGGLNSDSMREHPLRVRVREGSVTRIGVKSSVGTLLIDVQQCSTPGCPECVWPVANPSASGWWQKSPSSKIAPTSAVRAITCRRWSLRSLQLQEFSMKALPNNHDISIPSPLYTTSAPTIARFTFLGKIFPYLRFCLATRAQLKRISKREEKSHSPGREWSGDGENRIKAFFDPIGSSPRR